MIFAILLVAGVAVVFATPLLVAFSNRVRSARVSTAVVLADPNG